MRVRAGQVSETQHAPRIVRQLGAGDDVRLPDCRGESRAAGGEDHVQAVAPFAGVGSRRG